MSVLETLALNSFIHFTNIHTSLIHPIPSIDLSAALTPSSLSSRTSPKAVIAAKSLHLIKQAQMTFSCDVY